MGWSQRHISRKNFEQGLGIVRSALLGIGEFGDNLSIFRDINVLGLCKQKIPSKVAFQFRRSNQHVLASPLAILLTFIISNRAKYAADSYKITRELPDNLMWDLPV